MRIDLKNQNLGLDKINLEGKLELKKWKDKNKKQKRKKKEPSENGKTTKESRISI